MESVSQLDAAADNSEALGNAQIIGLTEAEAPLRSLDRRIGQ